MVILLINIMMFRSTLFRSNIRISTSIKPVNSTQFRFISDIKQFQAENKQRKNNTNAEQLKIILEQIKLTRAQTYTIADQLKTNDPSPFLTGFVIGTCAVSFFTMIIN